MINIGIIGCGGIANQKHFPALMNFKDRCRIVAFCDIIRDRAEKAKHEYGTDDSQVYTDYNELLQNRKVDVVYVLTPNVAHCEITVAAFEAGKNVLCEKPMASNSTDASKMIAAWKKSGKLFTIGYQNRFRPEVRMLKESCEKGELGEIYYAKALAVRRRAVPTWGVFPNKALQGGGPLIDIGTHALDMTLWMMDNYKPVAVMGSVFYKLGNLPQATEGNLFGPWNPETFEVEDSAFGMIKMADGATINLEASWALNILDSREASTTLCGTLAGAEVHSGMSYMNDEVIINRGHNGKLTEERISANGKIAYFNGKSEEPAVLEADQWLRALETGSEVMCKPEQAFVVTKILEAIYESAKTGKTIYFDEMEE